MRRAAILDRDRPGRAAAMLAVVLLALAAWLPAAPAGGQEPSSRAASPPLPPAKSAREVLERYGVSDSQLDGFFTGQPLGPAEEEVLIRLLFLYPRFGQENVEAWLKKDLSWDQLAAAPQEHQAELFAIQGRARKVVRRTVPDELVSRFDFDHYFEVHLQTDDAPYTAVVYCKKAPADWPLDADLDERSAAQGLFLKVGEISQERPQLLFAAGRVAWLPDRPDPARGVTPGQVALAARGVDIGLLREVGQSKESGILATEREPFYQVLAALREADELSQPRQQFDIVPLLREPARFQGSTLPVRGIARRVTKILVPDQDIRRRFGIEHYYEVDVTAPLDKPIRIGADPKNKTDVLQYENGFPVTLCVLELPEGLSEGDEVRQLVAADGIFFKLWTYRSAFTSQSKLLQPAPLLLARSVRLEEETPPVAWVSDAVVATVMVLAAATFIAIFVWFKWSDRRAAARPAGAATAEHPPDFSQLQ